VKRVTIKSKSKKSSNQERSFCKRNERFLKETLHLESKKGYSRRILTGILKKASRVNQGRKLFVKEEILAYLKKYP